MGGGSVPSDVYPVKGAYTYGDGRAGGCPFRIVGDTFWIEKNAVFHGDRIHDGSGLVSLSWTPVPGVPRLGYAKHCEVVYFTVLERNIQWAGKCDGGHISELGPVSYWLGDDDDDESDVTDLSVGYRLRRDILAKASAEDQEVTYPDAEGYDRTVEEEKCDLEEELGSLLLLEAASEGACWCLGLAKHVHCDDCGEPTNGTLFCSCEDWERGNDLLFQESLPCDVCGRMEDADGYCLCTDSGRNDHLLGDDNVRDHYSNCGCVGCDLAHVDSPDDKT